ncbi:MAG: hypothetical protein ABSG36_08215 [Acidimicrobiales bacterium]
MSSLWTPEGEHRVPRPGEEGTGSKGSGPAGSPDEPGSKGGAGRPGSQGDLEDKGVGAMSDEELAAEEELLEVAKHLAAAPAEDVVANHCYGLFELGALHLSQQPPDFEKARLAIDALGLLVDGLGERLGRHAAALAEGLSQIRVAFVRISSAAPSSDGQDAPETQA